MNTPLTLEMLLQMFEQHNTTFAPWTWVIYFGAVVTFLLGIWSAPNQDRFVSAGLGALWLWSGIAFFVVSVGPVYPLANIFGVVFVLQGLAFLYAAWLGQPTYGFRADLYGWLGLLLGILALVGYPVMGYLMGEQFPRIAMAGAPCPTTILTFGLLLMTRSRVPLWMLIIPTLWAVAGIAAIQAGMWPDVLLLVSGVVATALIVYRDRRKAGAEPTLHTAR